MNIKELIKLNDTLAFLVFCKKISKEDLYKYINNDIKFDLDDRQLLYSFFTFIEATNLVGYRAVQLCSIKNIECEKLYKNYTRYKKLIALDEIK